ncbi:16S rRNA (guanine(527)-N(7))-methyltransferase RsmG [Pseudodesulfovibrio sp.]|uniref:16S rRNA (guanine(527)-N(7))-methyltransferase RsmG n=1 Tax=unclassified Pseudodesulfovibrio TaxID=2661612 RepID=UPI003AFFCE88
MISTNPAPKQIEAAAKRLDRTVTPEQAALLGLYLDQLVKWNRKMNLVGKADWKTVFDTLMVDSLYLAEFLAGLELPESPLALDLGAGAGLPGIPLRAMWREGSYLLVEVREKRSLFMRSVLGRMQLPETGVLWGKAEEVLTAPGGTDGRRADLILSRAFMPWRELLDLVRPLLTDDGTVVILSNDPLPDDLPEGWRAGQSTSYPAAGTTRYFWSLSPA